MRQTFFLFALLLFFPALAFSSELNAGFVQGLWYSSEPVFTGVPTRIYVAVRNNTPHDLTGTVRFADNGKRIGSSEIRALSGRLVEAWVDWVPTEGEHAITAQVTDATLHIIGGGTQPLDVAGITIDDSLSIDTDTDRDGVGNMTDTDDDNDGVSDEDERERGSNPLVAQTATRVEPEKEEVEEAPAEVKTKSETSLTEPERGLERYLAAGTTDTLLGNATDKIENAKTALDEYRRERNEAIGSKANGSIATTSAVGGNDAATITRSRIETQQSILGAFVTSVASILSLLWTFVLWVVSHALGQPALIELVFLIGIVFLIYRIARRYGRRPRY